MYNFVSPFLTFCAEIKRTPSAYGTNRGSTWTGLPLWPGESRLRMGKGPAGQRSYTCTFLRDRVNIRACVYLFVTRANVENLIPAGSVRASRIKGIVDESGSSGSQVRMGVRPESGQQPWGSRRYITLFVGPPKHPYSRWTLRRTGARGKLNDKIWRTCLLAASCRDVPLSSESPGDWCVLNVLHQESSSTANRDRYDPNAT